jgi:hypothetical protein
MTPWMHSESSAKAWGGEPADYIHIHDWLDETKQYTGDWTHRAMRHHAAGVQWAIEKFGHVLENSEGRVVPVKMIAERHVEEDCGFIPTVQDWMGVLKGHPEEWMLKVKRKTTTKLELTD